jgi:hypothetical protein
MANSDKNIGFWPVGHMVGGESLRSREYVMEPSTTIYKGDALMMVSGTVLPATADIGTSYLGIAAEYKVSPATGTVKISVYDDPRTVFEVQADTGTAISSSSAGSTVNHIAGSGSDITKMSGHEIDSSNIGSGRQFTIVDKKQELGNEWGEHVKLLVVANEHLFKAAVTDQDLNTTDSPTFNDVTFTDQQGDQFTTRDLAAHQLDVFNEMATTEFDTTCVVSSSIRTVTATQPESEKLEFIIDEKRIEQPDQEDMTVTHTGLNGTDGTPKEIYTYFQNSGDDEPELVASNTSPDGTIEHVDCVYEVVGSISASTANVYASNNVKPYLQGILENLLDRLKEEGCIYLSGMDITATATRFTITAGTARHVISLATIPALDINSAAPVDTQFTIEDDDTYTTYTDFQIDEYYDGVAVVNTHHVKCRIGVVINNPELTSARFHIIPQKGAQTYTTPAQAWTDAKGMGRTIPRKAIVKNAFIPIADIVIKNTTGTFTLIAHPDTGLFYDDVRGV